MSQGLFPFLSKDFPWRDRISWYDSIDSTNDEAKRLARTGAPHGTVLVAGHQTGGHGRRGRSFHSPEGAGIYLSVLLRPQCPVQQLMHLTCAAAVAMCDAVEDSAGFRPGIKWTNDLVYRGRKLGGILTELGFRPDGALDFAIVGIGINCLQRPEDFPPEIRDMAGSLAQFSPIPIHPEKIAAAMARHLWNMDCRLLSHKEDFLNRYRQDCVTLGQDVVLLRGDTRRYGQALDIDSEGALVVRFGQGNTEHVSSGEVSVRGMYGYL